MLALLFFLGVATFATLYAPLLTQFPATRVLLLTAHPDDECLFFAPTLLSLVHHDVYSLTLSTGNADGLGHLRRHILGVAPDRQWIVDHPNLQDNITQYWDSALVAQVVRPYILQHDIDTILTFDDHGVSGHPNHQSLPSAIRELIRSYNSSSPQLFTLVSVPLTVKYIGVVSPLLAKATRYFHSPSPVFVSGMREYWRAIQAMRKHKSQLVWFRYLYVLFSRYMWVNEWVMV
ncbi:N-acetylglucosaminylphosphatidylinositoldeacety la se [Amanita rubescens]|nr:N-acetylglucosaminylphosphatidylinositoldeacety la se [Amanita rubescens]